LEGAECCRGGSEKGKYVPWKKERDEDLDRSQDDLRFEKKGGKLRQNLQVGAEGREDDRKKEKAIS